GKATDRLSRRVAQRAPPVNPFHGHDGGRVFILLTSALAGNRLTFAPKFHLALERRERSFSKSRRKPKYRRDLTSRKCPANPSTSCRLKWKQSQPVAFGELSPCRFRVPSHAARSHVIRCRRLRVGTK